MGENVFLVFVRRGMEIRIVGAFKSWDGAEQKLRRLAKLNPPHNQPDFVSMELEP